jgi:hypothetical protein
VNWLLGYLLIFGGVSEFVDDSDFFVDHVRPLWQKYCYECHAGENAKSGFRLDVKSAALQGGELHGPNLQPGDPAASLLFQLISDPDADLPMPPEGPRLTPAEISVIETWIAAGTVWPEGIDQATLVDRSDHWAFKPADKSQRPGLAPPDWRVNTIDDFVWAKLAEHSLQPHNAAERRVWLRRVTLDLTGLPPTPAEGLAFVNDQRPDAFERVVDRLLESPEYGPRWAQHWLDVVRYADTHGFEVNTERPNAWPYRDYVIQAFQNDLPYDQFIHQQLVGDQLGEDAATGFLLTASVLLPGQIGQDEPSKRLARQDALDEIVANIGQTFLGLSIGCARCHDHRFDPISQRDYFSFQALVAGVEYEERVWRKAISPDHDSQQQTARRELRQIETQLVQSEPLANPATSTLPAHPAIPAGSPTPVVAPRRSPIQPQRNVDRFTPQTTTGLRFTILNTNRLEPCLDELEVWNLAGDNVATPASAVQVRSSGDTVQPGVHELRFVNDGHYGNSSSWMSNEMGRGWIEYRWSEPQTVQAVVWGRDRTGQYQDRLATDYRVEVLVPGSAAGTGAATTPAEHWLCVADHSDRWPLALESSAESRPTAAAPRQPPAEVETPAVLADGQRDPLLQRREELERQLAHGQRPPQVFGGQFRTPDRTYLLRRGNPELPQDELAPAMLSTLSDRRLDMHSSDSQRRLALAEWLTDPGNPLVSRVMVNRVWQGHFGTGIVGTPSDFGRQGERPSHPELLDWLAEQFVESGWSLKALHRLIVLSATYRQANGDNPQASLVDADNRLLWKYPSRRMDAEMLRDSLLHVAGRLNLEQGGPGYDFFAQRGGLSGFSPIETFQGPGLRRMIFAHKVRRERDAIFGVFDCPDAGQSTATRRTSTTPLQALNLLNSPFVIEQAEAMARRAQDQAEGDLAEQLAAIWAWTFGRPLTAEELQAAEPLAHRHGLAAVCRAVLNSNEFLYLP